MLDITLLKVTHAGELEARKLLPHIQDADVYCPESPNTEERIAKEENNWRTALSLQLTRSQFSKRITFSGEDPEMLKYKEKEADYLYRERKPKWGLERYTEPEFNRIMEGARKIEFLGERGCKALFRKDLKGFLDYRNEEVDILVDELNFRDRHIANNLENAEDKIKAAYPQVGEKDTLKVAVVLGALHSPERYLRQPVKIYDLRGKKSIISEAVERKIEGRSQEEINNFFIRDGLETLARKGLIPFHSLEIESLPDRDLERTFTLMHINLKYS